MPMHHDTENIGEGTSGAVQLAGQTSDSARCAISSTGVLWRQGIAGFAVPDINKWSVIDTNIGAQGQQC
jgi:hypothetical protein